MRLLILLTTISFHAAAAYRRHDFPIDVSELRLNEMVTNIDEMKVAVMGMAEYIQEINKNVKDVKLGLPHVENNGISATKKGRGLTVDEILKREELAQKLEKLFKIENTTKVEEVKEEMASMVETNFIKMLAAVLLTGPVQAQERTPAILRLMRNVLNKQVDFKPIIDRLPFLIRTSETNQFILLLKALRDNERSRQFGGLSDIGKIIDAAGKFDLKQVSGFLKEIPEIFEAVESVVDGVDEYFKR